MLKGENLMFDRTNIPLATLNLKGKCENNKDQMPIDLITV